MKKILTNLFAKLAMVAVLATAFAGSAWGQTTTYEQLTSIANIDETAQYVLGIDGTGFHYEGTSSWGKTALPSAQTPLFYTLKKASDGQSFTAETTISGTKYYLQIPTSNTFSMATSTGTNTAIIIGTTQVSGTNYAVTNKTTTARHLRINGTSGLRSYAGTTGSMAFFYKVVTSGGSSAVATTTTISDAGITNTDVYVSTTAGSLSATVKDANNNTVSGASVTWSGNNDAVATINASTGAVTLVGKGNVKFTASYAGENGVYEASSADYNMTVTSSAPYVQPTEFDINLNNTVFGVMTGNNAAEQSSTIENVVVIAGCKSSATSKTYYDSGHVRFYADSYLKFTAPSGYNITNVLFTAAGTWNGNISVNTGTYDNATKTWTGETEQLNFEFAAQNRISSVAINLKKKSSIATPTFSPQEGTYTGAQNVTITCETSGVDIYYTTDGTTPSATNGTHGTSVTISETSTLKAIAIKGDESSSVASAAYTIVTFDHAGTETDPYSVADAIKAIDNEIGVENVYAKGIVCTASSQLYSSKYLSYYISDDGNSSSSKLEAYNGLGINGAAFTSKDDVKVGDIVVIKGNLTKYNSTYEFAADNQLVSLNRPVYPIIAAEDVTIEYDATSGEIAYSISNATDATLTATCTADWISDISVTSTKVTFTATANEGNADRTATFTLSYTGAADMTVTVTQKHLVVDYVTLPFEWAGGAKNDLTALNGVSASGLGSDYAESNAPYLVKLDGAGDYVLIKTDSRPGKVTVGVKMLGGATTSKIKIQGSADGETFTDIEELTISGSTNDVLTLETSNEFATDARYVKILKSVHGSNVGVGPIEIAKYSTEPSISVSATSIDAPAEETQGTLNVTYKYIETSVGVEIQWFESDGTTTATEPAWISTDINSSYNVDYVIEANTGAARTAYFKVYGIDAETNDVYSELVTVSQAEYIPNYATLPFEWDSDFSNYPAGITVNGTVVDKESYLNITKTGTEVILQFNETPSTLTFDIRGNSFSGGTFKVQTSTDGVSYTDLETYTTLSATQSESFNLLPSVRFIKWVYVEKVNGNVGLGNIKLTAVAAGADSYTLEGKLSGGLYWASFYCSSAGYTLSDGAKAFTLNSNKQLYQLGDGDVIPANTAVVIISETDLITLYKSTSASASISGGGNILVGSDSAIAVSSGTPYVLGIVGDALGFYKYTGDKVPAMKAYYIVNQ